MITIGFVLIWFLGGVFVAISFDRKRNQDTDLGSIVFGGLLGIVFMSIAYFIEYAVETELFSKTILSKPNSDSSNETRR